VIITICLKLTRCLQIVIKNLVGVWFAGRLLSVGQSYLPESRMNSSQTCGPGFLWALH